MKKAIVLFLENKEYGKYEFEKGKAYELVDEPKDFINRWVKRGCEVLEEAKDVLPDPRFPVEEKKEEDEFLVELIEEVIEADKEEKVEEKKESKPKAKRSKKVGK